MNSLINIKKAPIEILQLISKDKKLLNLLYDDREDAIERDCEYPFNDLLKEEYLQIFDPIVDDGLTDVKRNTFLSVIINTIYFNEDIEANFSIYISTIPQLIKLKGNKNRLHELLDLVIQAIDGKKISCAGTIEVDSASRVVIDENRLGYKITFNVVDKQNKKAEI